MQRTRSTSATTTSPLKMQPVAVLLLAIAAVAPALAGAGTSSPINATCAALTDQLTSQPAGYCVSVLSNDTAAAAATDTRGVAVAAVNITAHMAASTLSAISSLVDDLTKCRWYYRMMVESLAGVLDDYRAGRFDYAAAAKAANASEVPNGCDILLFEGAAIKNPFAEENSDNAEMARLANDIAYLVARQSNP